VNPGIAFCFAGYSRKAERIVDPIQPTACSIRLVQNAHLIEMRGDSMRKNRVKPPVQVFQVGGNL
jgi:hypothetical protein